MSDASEPLATANPTATRPRVVVIVRPHAERVPAVDPSEETVGIPAPARNAQDTVSVGVPAPSSHLVDSANEETNVLEPGAVRAAIGAKSLIPPEDVPTERFVLDKSKKPRQRTAEDDRLVAAVIQLDLNAEVCRSGIELQTRRLSATLLLPRRGRSTTCASRRRAARTARRPSPST